MRSAIARVGDLDKYLVFTPERYIGRNPQVPADQGVPLSKLAEICRESVSSKSSIAGHYLIADTGDAEEGILKLNKQPVEAIGSSKKRFKPGDVVISRLRPYLRQVGLVDNELFESNLSVVGSTEFYVLRSTSDESISFLIPWLLSSQVQTTLANSVEGAHHPRFHQTSLMQLTVPAQLVEVRDQTSEAVEDAVKSYRHARRNIAEALRAAETAALSTTGLS